MNHAMTEAEDATRSADVVAKKQSTNESTSHDSSTSGESVSSHPRSRSTPLAALARVLLPVAIFAAGAAVLIIAGKLKPPPKKESKLVAAPRVETVSIEAYKEGFTLETDGSVVPFREIDLASEVSGRIKSKAVACRAGNYVRAGTVLFEIDPVDYDLEVRRLSKELRQAEISIHSTDIEIENTETLIQLAEEDLRLQRLEVARLKTLTADRTTSASEWDQARRAEIASRNALARLRNQVRLLISTRAAQRAALDLVGTRLEKAELDLKRTKVVSPIDGVIVSELVEEDAFIQRGATLVRVEDNSIAEITCDLRADQLFWLWEHASSADDANPPRVDGGVRAGTYDLPEVPAEIIYQIGGREFVWQGRLDRFDGSGLNPRTRTVPCRIVVDNPRDGRPFGKTASVITPPALVRGMFVKIRLSLNPQTSLATIPVSALQPGNRIWVVEDGHLAIRDVRVARLTSQIAFLEADGAGFKVGDQVVVTPLPSPTEGMEVRMMGDEVASDELKRKQS